MSDTLQQNDYQNTNVGTFEATLDYRLSTQKQRQKDRSTVFTDEEFPLRVAVKDHKDLKWLRPREFIDNPVFIAEETTRFDVGQGHVGTCWFLSILASISENQELFQRVMSSDDYSEQEGKFHCKFWRFGQWHDVYIDDCLPVKNSKVWSSRSASNPREMWVSLLEKAFARFHGSYDEVYGGWESNAYLALTGGVSEIIMVNKKDICPQEFFNRIKRAVISGALVTCSFKVERKGLYTGHSYSLNATETVITKDGKSVQLFRVRNPWGDTEWKGDWCDGSPSWSSLPMPGSSRIQIDKNDGEFWMSLEDGMKYLYNVTICSITPDVDKDGRTDNLNYITCMYGEWRGPTAAGSGERKLENNPQFVLTIPQEYDGIQYKTNSAIVIQLIQDIKRKKNKSDATCIDFQLWQDFMLFQFVHPIYKSPLTKDLQTTHRYRLKPGQYRIIPYTKKAGVEKDFLIRIFSESKLKLAGCTLKGYGDKDD